MTPQKRRVSRPFRHVESWVIDLDNTLYPSALRLFDRVEERMGRFIEELLAVDAGEAMRLQKQYFREHGTTLNGLIERHGVNPEAYLAFIHDIDLSGLEPSAALDRALAALPGRKVLFTNASRAHALRVAERLGVAGRIDAIFDIADAGYVPKPRLEPYRRLIERHGIEPVRAVLIDDIAPNLEPAAELGMTTVWVRSSESWAQPTADSQAIHHVAEDLLSWLESLIERD